MNKKSTLKIILQIIFDALIVFASFIVSFYLRGQIQLLGNEDLFSQYGNYIIWYTIRFIKTLQESLVYAHTDRRVLHK